MTDYIIDLHTAIFTEHTGRRKSHLVLDLIVKNTTVILTALLSDYVILTTLLYIIICPMSRWNKTYHVNGWISHNNNLWLIRLKDKQYQWVEKFSQLLAASETLYIIDYIITDESLY